MARPTSAEPAGSSLRPLVAATSTLRRARWLLLAYAGALAGFHVLVLAGVVATRALGHDTRRSTLATVQNLRPIDEDVWAGGQPDEAQYRELAADGVRLVVDLRSGTADDPILDDSAQLAELGIARLHLPVADGHVLSARQVDALVAALRDVDGLVLLHCGGGVGRSNSAAAAYMAAAGRNPSLLEAMAVGPMTFEQLWYVAAADAEGVPSVKGPVGWTVRRVSETLDAPRRALARARSGDPFAATALAIGAVALGTSAVPVLRRPSRATAPATAARSGERSDPPGGQPSRRPQPPAPSGRRAGEAQSRPTADEACAGQGVAMTVIQAVRSEDVPQRRLTEIRALLVSAFDGDFSADDWAHTLGGWHVIADDQGVVVAHAAVVGRSLEVGVRRLRAGYVEGVATQPGRRREGLGSLVMRRVGGLLHAEFDVGALSTGSHEFYERLGWERWQGPTYVRRDREIVRTADEDDGIMVLRYGATADLDLTAPISCTTRPGDDW